MAYTKEKRIVNKLRGYTNAQANKRQVDRGEQRTPIATGMYLPNHSGLTGNTDAMNKLDDRYVNVTGDTMTGDLKIQEGTGGTLELASTASNATQINWKTTDDGQEYMNMGAYSSTNNINTHNRDLRIFADDDFDYLTCDYSEQNITFGVDTIIIKDSNSANECTIEATTTGTNFTSNYGSFNFNDKIVGVTKAWDFTIINPNATQDVTNEIFIAWALHDLTITKIQVELDISTQEVTGDIKHASDFQSLGSATVINDFDTTSGKRTDTSISSGSVSSGKAIYLSFDAQPHADIKQMHVHIEYDYD